MLADASWQPDLDDEPLPSLMQFEMDARLLHEALRCTGAQAQLPPVMLAATVSMTP